MRDTSPGQLGIAVLAVLLVGCLATLLIPPRAGAATEQHLFDPVISLTGTCSTEASDEVADPWCPGPPAPSDGFEQPNVAIDSFGDMYVSSHEDQGSGGRVDVFSPAGEFITELQIPGARSLAVDSKGNLYVGQFVGGEPGLHRATLFRPSVYQPGSEEISYPSAGEVVTEHTGSPQCTAGFIPLFVNVAIDPETDRLFTSSGGGCVSEWSSASAEGGPALLDSTIGSGVLGTRPGFIAVDSVRNRLYVGDVEDGGDQNDLIRVFELEAPHAYLGQIDGHSVPNGKFLTTSANNTLAVDEASGNLIVSELSTVPIVYEMGPGLDGSEEFLQAYEYFGFKQSLNPLEVAVDNAPSSPNHRTIYVPSGGKLQHTFAFRLSEVGPPDVESAAALGVTETEAVLSTKVNPNGAETTYRIEYTTAASGFEGAVLAAQGTLPAGIGSVPVSAPIGGLVPGATYRFLVSAENSSGSDQLEAGFTTYTSPALGGPCANDPLRVGFSAHLPDCRAYELVSPSDTNGRSPRGAGETGLYFPMLQASPDGNRASFRIEGGTIPGMEGSGSFNGDNYLSKRGPGGWSTELMSARGTDALAPAPGGISPDQEYSFWKGETSLENALRDPHIRYPDGHSEALGRGSLGIDPTVEARLISQNGSHTLFSTRQSAAIQLEPEAPPAGTAAIYDRTADEVTHVVSLLPGDVTPAAGKNAQYLGASLDGEGVAFALEGALYLRQDNEDTYEIGSGLTYAGLAEGGGRIFYLKAGNLFAFDAASETAIQFSKGGSATPVNVSADGSTAYFLSPDVLTGKKENPSGAIAKAGEENLYVSRDGQLGFVGTVESLDVEEPLGGTGQVAGLGQWTLAVTTSKPAAETARTTPDGGTLLFESRAPLVGNETNGHKEIYRYGVAPATLSCLSCNPTGAAASGDASLQTLPRKAGTPTIIGLAARMLNIRPDGERVFFQSEEALVAADVDNRQDVYEWEAQGVGSCTKPGGCLYLISFGQSGQDEHLFAVSQSGDDVFILSESLLLGRDKDSTASIYDARVGGGFPEAAGEAPCQGESCKGALAPPPALLAPATPALNKNGNVVQRPCAKGKRKVRRHGKVRCVKKHQPHRQAAAKRGQAR